MEVSKEIVTNVIIDWKKKDIPKEERAELVDRFIKEYGYTERKLSEETGIPRSTLNDWRNPDTHGNPLRKRVARLDDKLEEIERYLRSNEKLFNVKHLDKIRNLARMLEKIKNDIEFKRVQGD